MYGQPQSRDTSRYASAPDQVLSAPAIPRLVAKMLGKQYAI